MAAYRIDSIGQLARELAYTPADTAALQLPSAEDLLHEIDASRAYPLDYVIFRITGYHPRVVAADLLTGLALQHDLGLLIEQLSEQLQLIAAQAGEPVLSIDDITEQFNITSKTVQRWRRRGLPARRFVFSDGKRRVGFLLSSVERFILAHRDQVAGANPNLSRVEATEAQWIIRAARRLATASGCWPDEIARRIGKRIGRSPLTVLHTIRLHDESDSAEAVFPLAALPIGEKSRARIVRRYRKGWTLGKLAARAGRPRSAIYRVILDARIEQLSRRKTRFIDDLLYHQPEAESQIDTMVAHAAEVLGSPDARADQLEIHRSGDRNRRGELPAILQSLCAAPLLTAARERALFLQFNFYKYQFVNARRKLDPQFASWRQLRVMEHYLDCAARVRNQIVSANLRLIVSVARKHLRPGEMGVPSASVLTSSLLEMVSDGSVILLRAAESFDIHRGNRFSTYATLSLMKGFAQSRRSGSHSTVRESTAIFDELQARSPAPQRAVSVSDDVAFFLDSLSVTERRVVQASFGLGTENQNSTKKIASRLGVSPGRGLQIEKSALAKMRDAAAAYCMGE